MDLDAYFRRIGYAGEPTPSLATLGAIIAHHAAHIPFEAIDVLLGRGVDLAPDAIADKLVRRGRGGYCFEQNGLLFQALTTLGYAVSPRLARVLWMRPPSEPAPPATHMVLIVRMAGRDYLADAGFGNGTPTAPLAFDVTGAQRTPLETFRLSASSDGHRLDMQIEERWAPVYEVLAPAATPKDLEAANRYTSTHPESRFRRDLLLARATDKVRFLLLGNRLAIRPARGRPELRHFETADSIAEAVETVFGLAIEPGWHGLFESVADLARAPRR